MDKTIAIITDFGTHDAYAAIMKGVISGLNPDISIIDITHEVEPFCIASASFLLYSCWDYFPEGTIFLSVVDPGVGSKRGILIAEQKDKFLITPDNGSATLLYYRKEGFKAYAPSARIMRRIRNRIPEISRTFHGRDIFAPLAALLSVEGIEKVRGKMRKPVLLRNLMPLKDNPGDKETGIIRGTILHIDRFGNCISSIHADDLAGFAGKAGIIVEIGNIKIRGIKNYFSEVPDVYILAYFGSSGFLEIAANMRNASQIYKIKTGDSVTLYYKGVK
ncbi:MAG: SAM-dependent chlorinase/fluorinase [Spirochaetes bacterium]|nr:SAM-dependent chlorinase/fluorinase [Spirochaetota bacterium]